MYIRTTTLGSSTMMTNYLLKAESHYNQLAEEASSGKKSVLSSSAAVNLLNTNQKLNQLNGYNDNMSLAQNELNVLDNTLSSVTDQMQKANDLAVQASNGTCSQDELNNIKIQIDQILQNMQDLSNTQYNGNYIFSGTKTTTEAYKTDSSTGDITYQGTPKDGQYKRYVEIADGVSDAINVSGDQIFGSYTSGTTPSGSGILGDLKMLSNALGKGDNTAIRSSLTSMGTDLNNISEVRTTFASVSQRFDMTTNSNTNLITQLKEYKSSLEDVDLSQTMTSLSSQYYSLQASMSVTSQMLKMSLLNYM